MSKHNPQLNTIKMVEVTIKKYNGEYTKTQLWRKLDKKMMYQTYKKIIDYLLESRKIIIQDRKLIWIFNPELMDRLIAKSVKV